MQGKLTIDDIVKFKAAAAVLRHAASGTQGTPNIPVGGTTLRERLAVMENGELHELSRSMIACVAVADALGAIPIKVTA